MEFKIDEVPVVKTLPLITAKPIVYACNVGSDAFSSENGMKLANKFIEYVN
jgi:ribosome-binding ATPase YchF (GTP1/OBG family)